MQTKSLPKPKPFEIRPLMRSIKESFEASMVGFDGVERAYNYCLDVELGARDEGNLIKQAVSRFYRDLEMGKYTFDFEAAERVISFIEMLKHIKGPLRGERIRLEPWQCFIYANVYGFKKQDGNRRFKRAYLEVARGNGKSALSSGTAVYAMAFDNEGGAEVYSAATTRDQARIVFDVAKSMINMDQELQDVMGIQPRAHHIDHHPSESVFRPLSAEGSTLDGLNVHLAVIDEFHAHKTREVYDVLLTGAGKRLNPLIWLITTAGFNLSGVCYEERTYVSKILDGSVEDDTVFGAIYTLDVWDDWQDQSVWPKANPNWGISVMEDAVLSAYTKAEAIPSAQANFRTKHLNQWMNADHAFMDMNKWDKSEVAVTLGKMAALGCPLYLGIDLAAKTDLAAKSYVFALSESDCEELDLPLKVRFITFSKFYLPRAAIIEQRNASYEGWGLEGYIEVTEGEATDFRKIESDIIEDNDIFNLIEVAYDPWQATQMAQNLMDADIDVIEFRNTVANMSEPMKEIDALTREGKLVHEKNPCMRWCTSNVVAHIDAKDNVFPRKSNEKQKIDGFVALIFALARALFAEDSGGSIYDDDSWY